MEGVKPTEEDLDMLRTRVYPDNVEEFEHAIKIFPTRKLAKEENIKQLKKLKSPIF